MHNRNAGFILTIVALFVAGCGGDNGNGDAGVNGSAADGAPSNGDLSGGPSSTGSFSLRVPESAVTVPQSGRQEVTIGIEPAGGFQQPVQLLFDLPTGVTVMPEEVTVAQGETEAKVTIVADDSAKPGKTLIRVRAAPEVGEPQFGQIDIEIAAAQSPEQG